MPAMYVQNKSGNSKWIYLASNIFLCKSIIEIVFQRMQFVIGQSNGLMQHTAFIQAFVVTLAISTRCQVLVKLCQSPGLSSNQGVQFEGIFAVDDIQPTAIVGHLDEGCNSIYQPSNTCQRTKTKSNTPLLVCPSLLLRNSLAEISEVFSSGPQSTEEKSSWHWAKSAFNSLKRLAMAGRHNRFKLLLRSSAVDTNVSDKLLRLPIQSGSCSASAISAALMALTTSSPTLSCDELLSMLGCYFMVSIV